MSSDNSTLIFTRKSFRKPEELRSYLRKATEISSLRLEDCGRVNAKVVEELWKAKKKLKVQELVYDNQRCCTSNRPLLARCLTTFRGSLNTIVFKCCSNDHCPTLMLFAKHLGACRNLEKITIGRIDEWQDLVYPSILNSLESLPIKSLHLSDFDQEINTELITDISNAPRHSLSEITISECAGMDFQVDALCESLEPAGAGAIETLKMLDVDSDLERNLSTLPGFLPNLSLLVIDDPKPKDPTKLAQAIEKFMHECEGREKAIEFELTLYDGKQTGFGEKFWSAIGKTSLKQTGTKRNADMTLSKRTLTSEMATVKINVQ